MSSAGSKEDIHKYFQWEGSIFTRRKQRQDTEHSAKERGSGRFAANITLPDQSIVKRRTSLSTTRPLCNATDANRLPTTRWILRIDHLTEPTIMQTFKSGKYNTSLGNGHHRHNRAACVETKQDKSPTSEKLIYEIENIKIRADICGPLQNPLLEERRIS